MNPHLTLHFVPFAGGLLLCFTTGSGPMVATATGQWPTGGYPATWPAVGAASGIDALWIYAGTDQAEAQALAAAHSLQYTHDIPPVVAAALGL